MLRLPYFQHHKPKNVVDALMLAEELVQIGRQPQWISGGTDILVNMKHEFESPSDLISTQHLDLNSISIDDNDDDNDNDNDNNEGYISIGAGVTLSDLCKNETIQTYFPALVKAAGLVAGPQLRNKGTLGGNICLNTRCLYINQTHFWRESLGYCLKKDGEMCHVIKGGKNCVAAASNDTALPLMLHNALVEIQSFDKTIQMPLREFYTNDGIMNKKIGTTQLLTKILIPINNTNKIKNKTAHKKVGYEKIRIRRSIDYPLLSLGLSLESKLPLNGSPNAFENLEKVEVGLSAMAAKPKIIDLTTLIKKSESMDGLKNKVGDKVFKSFKPLTNLATDVDWRKQMAKVTIKRLFESVLS